GGNFMGAAENIATIKSVYDAFAQGDIDSIVDAVTDNVDWSSDTSSAGAPWYGLRKGKEQVLEFFMDFGKAMEVETFEPLTFGANDDGDVFAVVRFVARSRDTGKRVSMHLHHWFVMRDGKIEYYRGTEDTAITVAALS